MEFIHFYFASRFIVYWANIDFLNYTVMSSKIEAIDVSGDLMYGGSLSISRKTKHKSFLSFRGWSLVAGPMFLELFRVLPLFHRVWSWETGQTMVCWWVFNNWISGKINRFIYMYTFVYIFCWCLGCIVCNLETTIKYLMVFSTSFMQSVGFHRLFLLPIAKLLH